jgi:U3 small nucleolar RNA-associated protein 14
LLFFIILSFFFSLQVSDLPYPFNSVNDFEASVRAPIGSTWIPETAHRKLTAPRVIISQGQIIAPMTEEVLSKADS